MGRRRRWLVAVLFVSLAMAAPAATEFVFERDERGLGRVTPAAEAGGMAVLGAALILLSGRLRRRGV